MDFRHGFSWAAFWLVIIETAGHNLARADEPVPLDESAYEIVVVGKRPLTQDNSQDSTLVDGQKLRDSSRSSMLESLAQESASVYVPARGALHGVANGATGGIYIRGLGGSPNSQVLVVENGVPDYQGIFGHPLPDAYVPFLLDDAAVIKGGDSVLYGSNAMGGVIVLRSRWRGLEGYEVQGDSAYGSYSTLRQTASVLGKFRRWELAGAILAMSTDGHRLGAGGNELIGHTAARWHATSNLRLILKNKIVHLAGADPGPVTNPHPDNWYDVWRDNAALAVEWRRGPMKIDFQPSFNLGVHRLYDGFFSTDYVAGVAASMEQKLPHDTEILVGIDGHHINGEVKNLITGESPSVKGMTDAALFGQLALRPFSRWSLILGARELFNAVYGLAFLYKVGAIWQITRDLQLRTHLTRNFRQPTLRELYLPFPTSNPDLRPEYSLNADAGVEYTRNHWQASATAYRTAAQNMIRYFGVWPSAEVVNIDHLVIWGVEGRAGFKEVGPFSFFVTGDWRDVGRYTRQNPNAKFDATLDVSKTKGAHFIGGSLTGEVVHGLYMANYRRQPLADTFNMDASVRYRYTDEARAIYLEPYLFLRNFLDRRYSFVDGYPLPGFNLLVGLKIGM